MIRRLRRASDDTLPIPLHDHRKLCHHWCVYRLTCPQYDALLWRSGNRCEVCRRRAEEVQKRPLYIDHDNRLGNGFDHVRGLVCCKCNAQLRYVDNGYRRPTLAQQRYLANAWFWTGLPPHRRGTPWLPDPQPNPNRSVPSWENPHASAAVIESHLRWLKSLSRS